VSMRRIAALANAGEGNYSAEAKGNRDRKGAINKKWRKHSYTKTGNCVGGEPKRIIIEGTEKRGVLERRKVRCLRRLNTIEKEGKLSDP